MVFKMNLLMLLSFLNPSLQTDLYSCYQGEGVSVSANAIKLEDIMESSRKPRPDKTIFFHVTNCLSNGYVAFKPRQACAIESAALNNPSMDIFVLFASTAYYREQPNSRLRTNSSVKVYENIFYRNNDLWKYTKDTPAEEWFNSGDLFNSDYLIEHTSDLVRLITLWRWGGIYMDLDVVVTKSFEEVPMNFAGAESKTSINNGVMSFDKSGVGHSIINTILKDFVDDFRGDIWAHNGPIRITNTMRGICGTSLTSIMTRERCQGFQVYPISYLYSISYDEALSFFQSRYLAKCLRKSKDSPLIHLWNSFSKQKKSGGGHTCYNHYAEQFCPNVYSSFANYF